MQDVRAMANATLLSITIIAVMDLVTPGERLLPFSVVVVGAVFAAAALTAIRIWPQLRHASPHLAKSSARVLIVGAGQAGQFVAGDLLAYPEWCQKPIGFVDDDTRKRDMQIHGLPVLGTIEELPRIVVEHEIDTVAIAVPSASTKELDRIVGIAQESSARIQIVPIRSAIMTPNGPLRLRDIDLDELLNRPPHASVADVARESLHNRTVLVTGARGSIGFELCKQILQLSPARVIALDNNETGLFYLQRELSAHIEDTTLVPVLADITDSERLGQAFQRYRPDVVFHAAAYKHVPMLEAQPQEAVFVNVLGTFNLCRLAAQSTCERFVFVSTDKAVRPVSVLGFSKRIGELTVRAHQSDSTIFCSVRFGNVVGSRGSALPEFVLQIDAGGPVTVTHPDAERFFMTIPEAASLVIQAGAFARGGELFMLDMGVPVKVVDLVKRIIRLRGLRIGKDIEIVFTGLRPGERLTEELVFDAERTRPTANPAVLRVEDDLQPSLRDLERRIDSLQRIARDGSPVEIRTALAELARDEPISVDLRLRPVV
jgi:FlaA1/EpsC-like NDP-sugar epimerase